MWNDSPNKLLAEKQSLFKHERLFWVFYAITDLHMVEIAPFWGILGSDKSIYNKDLPGMFPMFFEQILSGNSIDVVISDVNNKYPDSKLRYVTSDKMFMQSMKMYFDGLYQNGSLLQRRVDYLVAQTKLDTQEPYDGYFNALTKSYLSNKEMNKAFFIRKACEFLCPDDVSFVEWMGKNFDGIYTSSETRSI